MIAENIKLWLREQAWMRPVRLANLKGRQRRGLLPDWRQILGADWDEWQALRKRVEADDKAPRILMATSVGIHAAAAGFDSYLAVALTARGNRCDILLCDQELPACMAADYTWYGNPERFARHGSRKDLCTACYRPASRLFGADGLGFPILRYSALLTADDRRKAEDIAQSASLGAVEQIEIDGQPVGEQALAGALRFFARGEIDRDGEVEAPIMRRYLRASCLTLFALRRLFAERQYDMVIGHHGIYVPQGLVTAAAAEAGLRFVSWNPAYRQGCFIFSHGDSYHHTMLTEPTSMWEDLALGEPERTRLMRYLEDRAEGVQDWIAFHPKKAEASSNLVRVIGLDPEKPVVTLLTSVIWDAQLHYRQRAFENQVEWVMQTIRYFVRRPDLQLAIRIHPGEIRASLPSRQLIADEIAAAFRGLPRNIAIVKPNDRISSYALSEASDAVIIYATKTGIELAARGIPVIVAGESWLRGKGIGFECEDAESYAALLDRLPFGKRMDGERRRRAERYAYHFFFRRMIPLPGLGRARMPGVPFEITARGLAPFRPGASASLDHAVRCISTGGPFVFDEAG